MNFVFDLYGTLVDIHTDENDMKLWRRVAKLVGEDISAAEDVKKEYEELCLSSKCAEYHEIELLDVFSAMINKRNAKITPAVLAKKFRRLSMRRLRPFPYAKRILKDLRRAGAGVYLVSNAQSCFTSDELSRLGLRGLFDGIILSSEEGVKKPSRDIFDIAFSRFGIRAEDSVYVGNDLRDDVLGARGVGMKTVYIETEQSGKYEISLPSPNVKAKNHAELYDILLSMAEST